MISIPKVTAVILAAGALLVSCQTTRGDGQTFAPGENRVTFSSEGDTVIATLFLPEDYQPGDELPVIIVSGPWTQVKEQVGYRYSRVLADEGFAALAMDHRFWGESTGTPRYVESASQKALDIQNAVEFLQTVAAVDHERIGALGVCTGIGGVSLAIAADDRIRAMATIFCPATRTTFCWSKANTRSFTIRIRT